MKRLALFAGVMALLVATAVAASAQPKANFAGAWGLDKTKSQGLDQRMADVDVTWTITQDDAKISIESKVTGGNSGGGMGGGRGPAGPRTYMLDGKEVTADAGGQMG